MKHPALVLGAMWLIFVINETFFGGALNAFGLRPHTPIGLVGIITAPFLHINLSHIQGNTIAYLFLAGILLLKNVAEFRYAFWGSAFLGGLGTWIIGNPATTGIGASGAIYGLLGYLLSGGFWDPKSKPDLMCSFLSAVWFSSMIFGALPGFVPRGVSWEAHLTGFIAGVIVSYKINKPK